jgi:hypothetical protein
MGVCRSLPRTLRQISRERFRNGTINRDRPGIQQQCPVGHFGYRCQIMADERHRTAFLTGDLVHRPSSRDTSSEIRYHRLLIPRRRPGSPVPDGRPPRRRGGRTSRKRFTGMRTSRPDVRGVIGRPASQHAQCRGLCRIGRHRASCMGDGS